MSDAPPYDPRTGSFDPERFFAMARNYGHGRALGLEYRKSADDWIELALPWREELVGIPDQGILASGAIVSLLDTCAWALPAAGEDRPEARLSAAFPEG